MNAIELKKKKSRSLDHDVKSRPIRKSRQSTSFGDSNPLRTWAGNCHIGLGYNHSVVKQWCIQKQDFFKNKSYLLRRNRYGKGSATAEVCHSIKKSRDLILKNRLFNLISEIKL